MRVIGIDFTSAPSRRKTIACADCRLSGDVLYVEQLYRWSGFDKFESFLVAGEEWLAGIDAPLGQPRRLIEALNWPRDWAGYVEHIGSMTKLEFVEQVTYYSRSQPAGEKHHQRATDRLASSCSPMMMYGVPVGRMFYEAAPRLLRSNVSVLPCRPNSSRRVVVESYPALLARRAVGRAKYKNGRSRDGAKLASFRRKILSFYGAKNSVGVSVRLPKELREAIIAEPTGDGLDAVLCAIQIASSSRRRPDDLGIPAHADPLEGWIVDADPKPPSLLRENN